MDMPYKVIINTTAYKPQVATLENGEIGVLNDYMVALNNWHTTEPNLDAVRWRIELFTDNISYSSSIHPKYQLWRTSKQNSITYKGTPDKQVYTHTVKAYGTPKAYFDLETYIKKLKQNKIVRIYLSELYTTGQQLHNLCKVLYGNY